MSQFFGFYSPLFFTLILGFIWPHKTSQRFWIALLGYFAKSLWLAWFLFFISFYSSIGAYMPLIILIVSFVILAYYAFRSGCLMFFESVYKPGITKAIIAAIIFTFILLCVLEYEIIFSSADAVFSWNRWGIELSQNMYKGYGIAYPLLFPGIWSLVYEAQGNAEIWYTAKLVTLTLPLLLALSHFAILTEKPKLPEFLFLVTTGLVTILKFEDLTSGWMDYPVFMMIQISLLMLYYSVQHETEPYKRDELFLFAVLFASLAAITKQAGSLSFIPIIYVLLSRVITKKIQLISIFPQIIVMATPIFFFLIIYYNHSDSLFGSLTYFQKISDIKGNFLANHLYYLLGLLKKTPWIVLFLPFIYANFKKPYSLESHLGILCLLLSVAGYIIYTNCCSYHARNGIWISAFLTASAMFGAKSSGFVKYLETFTNKLSIFFLDTKKKLLFTTRKLIYCVILIMGIPILLISSLMTIDQAHSIQVHYQKRIGNDNINHELYKYRNTLGSNGAIVTPYQYVKWLPELRKTPFVQCHSLECIDNIIKKHPGSLILHVKYYRIYHFHKPYLDAYPDLTILAETDSFALYLSK